ncbi:type II toxin-antitoxin system VapC family toxin [Sphingomonas echinoides]|uniref:Type II toxin-antitoxin system VapC family toxin n=1 Tax=Sphingomonas echinoides TaxID=59803 RepID=A0ABU4PP01_9SPHN|nr:type II toxin-antitoxin system VapC family toxin [Sphingomonas echinoides]MDX5985866.1 type II toxin-antitoxin system VapC family toxin [Sphingomonas echinoides]
MRLLLDTHIALWAIGDPARLAPSAVRAIEQADDVAVSAVAIWEIAIKHALRRDRQDDILISGREARLRFVEAGFSLLPITAAHAEAVDDLPPLHADPFDRMLVAQARTEPMHLMTHDARLADYPVLTIVV